MGRRPNDSEPTRWVSLILFLMGLVSCSLVYMFMSVALRPTTDSSVFMSESLAVDEGENGGGCCRGIENLELWGAAVKWGSDFKFSSSEECCQACKNLCSGNDGLACVILGCFVGIRRLVGRNLGIVGLETEYGMLHIKLLPDCAPHSVNYILQRLELRHCAGCHFYRAESRGQSWNSEGNHIKDASLGPPFALVQGVLEAQGTIFNKIPKEDCLIITRGSVAWVGSGPEFFISLANHEEWRKAYTVFGSVLPEDMVIAEKIAELPTKSDVWNNINVSVLEKPVPFWFQRIQQRKSKSQ